MTDNTPAPPAEEQDNVVSIELSFENHTAYGAFDVRGNPVLVIAPGQLKPEDQKGAVPPGSALLAFTDPASVARIAMVLNGLITTKAEMVQKAKETLQSTPEIPALEHQGAARPRPRTRPDKEGEGPRRPTG